MENIAITREDALRRFRAAKAKKKACLAQLEKAMRKQFKEQTGQEAISFNVW